MKATNLEYNHTATMTSLTLENKVESFFFYDLTRFAVHTAVDLMRRDMWPKLTHPTCDRMIMTTEQINERQ